MQSNLRDCNEQHCTSKLFLKTQERQDIQLFKDKFCGKISCIHRIQDRVLQRLGHSGPSPDTGYITLNERNILM